MSAVFTTGWVIWLAGFVVLESIALARKEPGDTLSEHVWKWFRVKDYRPSPLVWLARVPLLVGGVWLTGHLGFGLWSW